MHLIEAGGNIFAVQKILGHGSILSTIRYTRLTDHRQQNNAERISKLPQRHQPKNTTGLRAVRARNLAATFLRQPTAHFAHAGDN